MISSKKTTIALVSSIIAAAALGGLGVITSITTTTVNAQVPGMTTSQENTTTSQQQSTPTTAEGTAASTSNTITMQKTGVSSPDPLPGHSGHQLVMALAPRSDGKVWVGTVTWTASKPVEVVVLHNYNSSITGADAAHGQPLTVPFGKGAVAISLIKTPSGTPVASGTMPFAGNALAFHTLSGDKFTVTYTVDATAKQASSSLPSPD
jgi:cytoskeletal protein RodZ